MGWFTDPGLTFGGSANPATPVLVAGGNGFTTSKVEDVRYLAFAVADAKGRCAGGLLLTDSGQ